MTTGWPPLRRGSPVGVPVSQGGEKLLSSDDRSYRNVSKDHLESRSGGENELNELMIVRSSILIR